MDNLRLRGLFDQIEIVIERSSLGCSFFARQVLDSQVNDLRTVNNFEWNRLGMNVNIEKIGGW